MVQVIEKHYTINELAERLTMSFERTRQLVMDEPGVLRIAAKTHGERRTRTMYRIPESVIERILRRSANPPQSLRTTLQRQLAFVALVLSVSGLAVRVASPSPA